jgi:hypothetical protein
MSVGGDSRAQFDGAIQTVKDFFLVHEADYRGELLYSHVDAKGEIERHPTALQEAFDLGIRAVKEAW